MTRLYNVTREEVHKAWLSVQAAQGCPGCDEQSIEEIRADLDNQLYKIWNRMSSGSYIPAPVKLVAIPKAKGGVRMLGIATVADRIVQTVIKNRLEEILESKFHSSSYGYRPNRSAIDAVAICREQCFKHEWLLEVDIKSFFDDLDHGLTLEMLQKHTDDKVIFLYAKKFLKAKGVTESGEIVERDKGACQGGCVSPILANLYLHEAFDTWMAEEFPALKFERYADDLVIHCVSERQAYFMKNRLTQRLQQLKLALNLEKTKVVYTGQSNKHDSRGHKLSRKFTFLGYDFKPRNWKDRIVFTPGMGNGALVRITQEIKAVIGPHLTSQTLEALSLRANQIINGWINYYGHFRRSDLKKMAHRIDVRIVSYLRRKYDDLLTWTHAWRKFERIKRESPQMFSHWYKIGYVYSSKFKQEFCREYRKLGSQIVSQTGGAV